MSQSPIYPGEVFAKTTDFDRGIRQLLPKYDEMLETLARCLPPQTSRILELGCGTGELSLKIFQRLPEAEIVAVDYSPRMLEFARQKLAAAGYVRQWQGIEIDFGSWAFSPSGEIGANFDACISSLAIHHLSNAVKLQLFKTIHRSLNTGGAFWNADPVLAESPALSEVYQQAREDWAIAQGTTLESVRALLGNSTPYGYSMPDQLASIEEHQQMLHTAGFEPVAVPWKFYGLAVFGGFKYSKQPLTSAAAPGTPGKKQKPEGQLGLQSLKSGAS